MSPGGIPVIVEVLLHYLQQKGLYTEGIFRLSGSAERIQELKEVFNRGEIPTLGENDVHNAAGLLKAFLRELPEPLLTFESYNSFIAAKGISKFFLLMSCRCPDISESDSFLATSEPENLKGIVWILDPHCSEFQAKSNG